MARTAAEILVDTIHDWGIDTVFGLPGDGINGIMEALRQRRDRIRFVQVRHEESSTSCGRPPSATTSLSARIRRPTITTPWAG